MKGENDLSIGDEKTVGSNAGKGHGYAFSPGQALGSYQIIRPLGAGGMGEVYLAEHVYMHKRYALKVLPRALFNNAQFVDRFRIEARVMADLQHPHIVQVHHMDEQGGVYYLTMDYVAGAHGEPQTLDDILKPAGHPLAESRVLELMRQVCGALGYAHGFRGEGVVHRDLKPSNILLDEAGQVKIADFGLAKVVGGDYLQSVIERSISLSLAPSADRSMGDENTGGGEGSSTRSILGTYEYISPEQKRGEPVDARTDLYALGIMLYAMLTGRKPEGRWKLPSQLGCSAGWDAVVERCLEPEANERFQSVAALMAALPEAESRAKTQRREEAGTDLRAVRADEGLAAKERMERKEVRVEAASSSIQEAPRTAALPRATSSLAHKPVPTEPNADRPNATEQDAPSTHKKKGKGWLVVLLLLVCAGGGVYYVLNQDSATPAVRPAVTPYPAPSVDRANATKQVAETDRSRLESTTKKAAAPQQGKVWTAELDAGIKMEFMPIAAGSFQMGAASGDENDERPVRTVTLTRDFWMGKFEVTNAEYQRFVKEAGYDGRKDVDSDYLRHHRDWSKYASTGDNYPIVAVSWKNAVKFCEWLTQRERAAGRLPAGLVYRLPTEAEWEYAARGGHLEEETTYAGGNDLDAVAWHSGNSQGKTQRVGTRAPNELGLHDMSGNVWEWVHDWYQNSYSGLGTNDPSGPSSGSSRVLRGGSWSYVASNCRVANRSFSAPTNTSYNLGFRVVVAVPVQ